MKNAGTNEVPKNLLHQQRRLQQNLEKILKKKNFEVLKY